MEPFLPLNPKGLCKINTLHCSCSTVPRSCLGSLLLQKEQLWPVTKRAISRTRGFAVRSPHLNESCLIYRSRMGLMNVLSPGGWQVGSSLAWGLPAHVPTSSPLVIPTWRHTEPIGAPLWFLGMSKNHLPRKKKRHLHRLLTRKRQPRRSAPRCCSTKQRAKSTLGQM